MQADAAGYYLDGILGHWDDRDDQACAGECLDVLGNEDDLEDLLHTARHWDGAGTYDSRPADGHVVPDRMELETGVAHQDGAVDMESQVAPLHILEECGLALDDKVQIHAAANWVQNLVFHQGCCPVDLQAVAVAAAFGIDD